MMTTGTLRQVAGVMVGAADRDSLQWRIVGSGRAWSLWLFDSGSGGSIGLASERDPVTLRAFSAIEPAVRAAQAASVLGGFRDDHAPLEALPAMPGVQVVLVQQ